MRRSRNSLAANYMQSFVDREPNQPATEFRLVGKCAKEMARLRKAFCYDFARSFVIVKHFASDQQQRLPVT